MQHPVDKVSSILPRWAFMVPMVLAVLILLTIGSDSRQASALGTASPEVICPGGQCFHDVPASSPFYTTTNNLYIDNIVSGYACGGSGEPCDGQNRPYYRPNNNVTRAQMTKFVDLGRRNIADALGHSLVMTNPTGISIVLSNTTTDSIDVNNSSGAEAIQSICTRANQNCWAFYASTAAGDYGGVFSSGRGFYSSANDNGYSAVRGVGTGNAAASYGGDFSNDNWNALRVEAPPTPNGRSQAWVSGTSGTLYAFDVDPGAAYINGNLTVTGSKSGYVVDAMQNAEAVPLEPGDVVAIVGQSAPVLGDIPVVTVKKADTAYDTGVVGVVDAALYVPDAATSAAYEAQQQAVTQAEIGRNQEMQAALTEGRKPDEAKMAMPSASITDEQGIPHATDAKSIPVGGYANVVTLGSYKAVKVDASFGAIHAGDLLVASPHAGFAMKGTDRSLTSGATIGKALGDLETGTGTISVMVTLK